MPNVDAMLRELTSRQLAEWMAYFEAERIVEKKGKQQSPEDMAAGLQMWAAQQNAARKVRAKQTA